MTVLKIEISTLEGTVVQEFSVPKVSGITTEEAHTMGEKIAAVLNSVGPKVLAHNKKNEEACDCFWKDRSAADRIVHQAHSSECAVWALD